MENEEVLESLFARNGIDIVRGPIYAIEPSRIAPNWDRIEGMMLGLAIGDSLGNGCEGMARHARWAKFGEVRDYLPRPFPDGDRIGIPSDDTQLAAWTLEQLVADGRLVPSNLAQQFLNGKIRGAGRTTRAFLRNLKQGVPWHSAGVQRATNGALMRIAPIVIPHVRQASTRLWVDATLAAMMTHNDTASIASCVAFIAILWDVLGMDSAPAPGWWIHRFLQVANGLESGRKYVAHSSKLSSSESTFTNIVDLASRRMSDLGLSVGEACELTGSGMHLTETLPCVIAILARHADDPEEAIVRAVNDTSDNDTIAAIVGAAVGALHGANALPQHWKDGLLGRTRDVDDGRLFDLLADAKKAFGLGVASVEN